MRRRVAVIVPAVALAAAAVTATQLHGGQHAAPAAARSLSLSDQLAAGISGSTSVQPLTSQAVKTSPSPSASPKPAPSPKPKPKPAPPPPCKASAQGGYGMLPYNYASIVDYLVPRGYTRIAAAGIAGNIWQESRGNPESVGTGGGGLIGWTPLPAGFVTGNVTADLNTQLAALLKYNEQWAGYLPALNAATSATAAADVYMNDFERPGIPAASNREGAADAVASACGIS